MNAKRVFLLDDHPVMRFGLTAIINAQNDLEICGELGEGRGAVDHIRNAAPDVVILDLSLQDASGLEVLKDLRRQEMRAPILILSMRDETLYAERSLHCGANGYIMKHEATQHLIQALRTVLSGEVYLSAKMLAKMARAAAGIDSRDGTATLSNLTDREFEVYELIGDGLVTREVADRLNISTKTVDTHRGRIKKKLGIGDVNELIRHAVRWAEAQSVSA
ncbi:MAG: DNA-binding NarL/FixJ family response regulator [Verrucomicrobiales bacterium]|jgi:DNA-binding NarL/FixJ family response regulator